MSNNNKEETEVEKRCPKWSRILSEDDMKLLSSFQGLLLTGALEEISDFIDRNTEVTCKRVTSGKGEESNVNQES